jgi:hypothetical protein
MMYLVLPNSFRLARYLAPVALLAFVPLARPSADDYFPPPDAKGGWRTLSDPAKIAKTAGVDKQKLDEAFEYVQIPCRVSHLRYLAFWGGGVPSARLPAPRARSTSARRGVPSQHIRERPRPRTRLTAAARRAGGRSRGGEIPV